MDATIRDGVMQATMRELKEEEEVLVVDDQKEEEEIESPPILISDEFTPLLELRPRARASSGYTSGHNSVAQSRNNSIVNQRRDVPVVNNLASQVEKAFRQQSQISALDESHEAINLPSGYRHVSSNVSADDDDVSEGDAPVRWGRRGNSVSKKAKRTFARSSSFDGEDFAISFSGVARDDSSNSSSTAEEKYLPQIHFSTFGLETRLFSQDDLKVDPVLTQRQLEDMRKLRLLPPKAVKTLTSVCDLQPGDIIFIQQFNAVAFSQSVTRLFANTMTREGRHDSVHCMIVTSANGISAHVAHVTQDGGLSSFIEDPINPLEYRKLGMEPPDSNTARGFHGGVYRLACSEEIREKAAAIAAGLVESFNISYNTANAIGSVMKNVEAGKYLNSIQQKQVVTRLESKKNRRSLSHADGSYLSVRPQFISQDAAEMKTLASAPKASSSHTCAIVGGLFKLEKMDKSKFEVQTEHQQLFVTCGSPLKLSLFCSEFIIKCYQEALAHIHHVLGESELRCVDLNGEACSPMAFEGFLARNAKTHGDWQSMGDLYAEFLS
eukprot:TRINITY_DN9425_c0_g1_i1.p1 TRINITY_DN9425_c0_g1~~TRINITY_DN9425_c0_g1_i1.p1  ORF type:complete len:610 (-),score=146.80 TRINITY_DN9425_c0_g1_i1:30-1685(-)